MLPVSRSSSQIRPEVGSIIRLIIRSDVVLPQPDGPTSTVIWPDGATMSSWSTATVPSGYLLDTDSNRIIRSPPPCGPQAAEWSCADQPRRSEQLGEDASLPAHDAAEAATSDSRPSATAPSVEDGAGVAGAVATVMGTFVRAGLPSGGKVLPCGGRVAQSETLWKPLARWTRVAPGMRLRETRHSTAFQPNRPRPGRAIR